MTIGTIAFAGAGLDRADHIRADPDRLAGLMDWRARLLRLDGLDPVISPDGELEWGTLADADPKAELVFLGLASGKACFAEVSPALLGSVAPANPRLWAAMSSDFRVAMLSNTNRDELSERVKAEPDFKRTLARVIEALIDMKE